MLSGLRQQGCFPTRASSSSKQQLLGRGPHTYHAPSVSCCGVAANRSSSNLCDVVALSNLCVDVFVPVDELPPKDTAFRRGLLAQLVKSPPPPSSWEIGGNGNFIIAAARLGMRVASVGHVGNDIYGKFLEEVLSAESVSPNTQIAPEVHGPLLDSTLLCFVLVDPSAKHAFCSRYDFGPWPLLAGVTQLPPDCVKLLRSTKAVFTNGFVFDELPLELVCAACSEAIAYGSAVFFDPGPRCFTMLEGSRRQALDALLDLSTVVLMTEEEALTVTGHADPDMAAQSILARSGARTEWCVVKLGGQGAVLRSKAEGRSYRSKGLKVEVQDTVGCGDSFAAAIVIGYINGYSIPHTLALANAVGAATATGRGAGRNVASADKVMGLLREASSAHWSDDDQREHAAGAINILQMSLDNE